MSEARLSHYLLLGRIGEGGMGTVYRARDQRLGRDVAIKTLRDGGLADDSQRARFIQEAQAASALNHPNIVTVYEIGQEPGSGLDFIAMEYIEGEPVSSLLREGSAGVDLALSVGVPVASALAAAHRVGIVHRDLKPANVMRNRSGQIKLLDFGLAKLTAPAAANHGGDQTTCGPPALPHSPQSPQTASGMMLGTPAYMSPEQIEARPVDARSDVFALGLLLYELLCGERAFSAGSDLAMLTAILRDAPDPVQRRCRECPRALAALVLRCLEKDPQRRPRDAGEVLEALQRIEADWRERDSLGSRLRRPAVWVPVLVLLLAAASWQGTAAWQARKAQAELELGLGEIARLVESDLMVEAYGQLRALDRRFPRDARLAAWWNDLTFPSALRTDPPGAQLWARPYARPEAEWIDMGQSNQEQVLVVPAHTRWRIEKPGYELLELATRGDLEQAQLFALGEKPKGMEWVPAGTVDHAGLEPAELDGFWLDRTEVTNAQFQAFVDAGGYQREAFWQETFELDGQLLDFEQAMAQFRDSTGRPGPAGWELGRFPEGTDQHPVTGVSWYEAMAYARFVDKTLPAAHHWMRAAAHDIHSDVVVLGNFDGRGTVPVASREAMSPFGHQDLAGNVAEWVANGEPGRRLTLGGHWGSSPYLFNDLDGAEAFARSPHIGFRCARFDAPIPESLLGLPPKASGVFPESVGDEVFAAFARLYAHDPMRGEPELESVDEHEHWREETWRLPADYVDQQFRLKLYLPRGASPPYQLVLYAPPSTALFMTNIDQAGTRDFAFLLRDGRAVAAPAYYGTYERRLPPDAGLQARRSMRRNWSKDAGIVLDFLASRDDIDPQRIAFYGYSLGANAGISMLAVESRLATGILQASGFRGGSLPPENDPVNFAPRVRQPVLMIGGRFDFQNPVETSQQPLFDRLGSPLESKRLFLFDGGHVPPRQQEIMGAVLEWLDEQFGPVAARRP